MRRVFAVDVLECPCCGGEMKILATLHPPETTTAILACLGLPTRAPPTQPAFPDAEPTPPSYQVSVSDGLVATAPVAATIDFAPDGLILQDVPRDPAGDGDPGTDRDDGAAAGAASDRTGPGGPGAGPDDAPAVVTPLERGWKASDRQVGAAAQPRGFAFVRSADPGIEPAGPLATDGSGERDGDDEAGWEPAQIDLAANERLLLEFERLRRDLEEATRRDDEQGTLRASVELIGIAFSGALVAAALRSSALWAAALSSLPLWRRMDPLMVLGLSHEERRRLESQLRDVRDEERSGVGRVLDGRAPRPSETA